MALGLVLGVALSASVVKGNLYDTPDAAVRGGADIPLAQSRQSKLDLASPVTLEDVEIIARRGAAKLPPVVELDGRQIDAIGAWDISEVLNHLDDIYGGQGEPLILINGRLVPLPSVYGGFPPDAAVRVEVLPPEAAGLYGGRAGQTVYNLVLQPRYSNVDLGLGGVAPTQGGTEAVRLNGQRGAIAGMNSHQLRLAINHDTGLNYGDRNLDDLEAEREQAGLSLRPRVSSLELGGMAMRTLGGWGVVGNLSLRASEAQSTFAAQGTANDSRNDNQGGSLSVGVSGQALGWQVNADMAGSLNLNRQSGWIESENRSRSLGLNLNANRQLFTLPSGDVRAHLRLGLQGSRSEAQRDGIRTASDSQSTQLQARLNLPLIKAAETGWGRMGAVQADIALGRQAADGHQGEDSSLSLAWQPQPKLRLNLGLSHSQSGAVEAMRSLPVTYGVPRTVYDFKRGEAVEILPLIGGNPDLTGPQQQGQTASFFAGPFGSWQWSANLNYNRNRSTNGLSSLGDLTEEVQALFPERFVRSPDGGLLEVDYRPFNIGKALSENLGVNLSLALPIEKVLPPLSETISTVQIRLGYNRQLKAVSQLVPGLAEQDQLVGDGGGRSRQDARLSLETDIRSLRASLSGRWTEGYRSRRLAGTDGPQDLVRDDLLLVSLRLGVRLQSGSVETAGVADTVPRRRAGGTELSVDIDNLFDARPEVRLGSGDRALGYGKDRLDPMGRTLSLNLRRRF